MCNTCGCKKAESFENETFCADCGSIRRHDAESFEAEDKKLMGYVALSGDRYTNYCYVSINAEKLKESAKDAFIENNYDIEKEELEKMWDNFSPQEALEATGMNVKKVDLNKAIFIYDGEATPLNAETFKAPGSIAEDYSEVLHDLDDLEGDVKKLVAPKRRPTKYLRDAKSSVVDSWRQVRKDGFGRELYQPMDMEAESFEGEPKKLDYGNCYFCSADGKTQGPLFKRGRKKICVDCMDEKYGSESFEESQNLKCDLCGLSQHNKIKNQQGQTFYYCTNDEPNEYSDGCVWGDRAEGKWLMDDGMHYLGVVVGINNPANAYLENNCPQCGVSFVVSDSTSIDHCDGCVSDWDAESFEAESNFDKLANKIAAQYRAKGKSPAEAMRIGKATAAKIGFRKYGKAGMRRKAMAGRAKSAENYRGSKRIKVYKKSSIINSKDVGILSVAGILSYLYFKK